MRVGRLILVVSTLVAILVLIFGRLFDDPPLLTVRNETVNAVVVNTNHDGAVSIEPGASYRFTEYETPIGGYFSIQSVEIAGGPLQDQTIAIKGNIGNDNATIVVRSSTEQESQ